MGRVEIRSGQWIVLAMAIISCGPDDPAHVRNRRNEVRTSTPASSGARSAEAAQALNSAIILADSADKLLRRVPNLSRKERSLLLRDVNAVQIAKARQVGITRGSSIDELRNSGRLVELADTTELWVIRELDYSVPYVTPATEALLIEIGRRFQTRLDKLGIPRYRLEITSVLRTPEKQSELRKRNVNASREVSAHEFGTTVDIAYRHYGPPVQDSSAGPPLSGAARVVADSVLVEAARERAAELQAILGRVLQELRVEGRVLVRMERRQTVYHITATRASAPKRGA